MDQRALEVRRHHASARAAALVIILLALGPELTAARRSTPFSTAQQAHHKLLQVFATTTRRQITWLKGRQTALQGTVPSCMGFTLVAAQTHRSCGLYGHMLDHQ